MPPPAAAMAIVPHDAGGVNRLDAQRCTHELFALLQLPPLHAAATLEIDLLIHPQRCPGAGWIRGQWDPLLRRVELFGCATRSAAELAATYAHELAHVLQHRGRARQDEAAARRDAARAAAALGEARVATLAARLRDAAKQPVQPALDALWADGR